MCVYLQAYTSITYSCKTLKSRIYIYDYNVYQNKYTQVLLAVSMHICVIPRDHIINSVYSVENIAKIESCITNYLICDFLLLVFSHFILGCT